MADPLRLLLLGGTGEAVTLSKALAADRRVALVTSLAGRTKAPTALPGRVRRGGFGGSAGLADYLRRESVDLVIDATHPYAARISHHAAQACGACGTARLRLDRPAWSRRAGDRWTSVPDIAGAADALKRLGQRVFLTVGRQDLAPFAGLDGHWFLIRAIDPPEPGQTVPPGEIVRARGPFNEDDERALLRDKAIDAVVSKNSGGRATYPKIAAARHLRLPVVMIDRPAMPAGPRVATAADALEWLDRLLAAGGARGHGFGKPVPTVPRD